MSGRIRIMSSDQVERVLTRLAYEVVERNRGAADVCVLGIQSAGARLASKLADRISEIEGDRVPSFDLDVSAYRDDIARPAGPTDSDESEIMDLTGLHVILVDDVLFTGRTVRAALDAVIRFGRPRSIQLAVLIDRGHREFPVHADYVGRTIPTRHRERVIVTIADRVTVDVEE
jgi:pyrimidine operon attenuation protein / uracil phosphoribosyltransferase